MRRCGSRFPDELSCSLIIRIVGSKPAKCAVVAGDIGYAVLFVVKLIIAARTTRCAAGDNLRTILRGKHRLKLAQQSIQF